MAHSDGLSQWMQVVSTRLPRLSVPQARVLASYSYGMVMTGQCGQTRISHLLACLMHARQATIRQRLREWCKDATDKHRPGRQQLAVTDCFAPLLRWILHGWQSDQHQLVLVCDATALRQTFTILSISVVYRACAIPVAWRIVCGRERGSWQPLWLQMLEALAGAVPADWQVLVLADRGLYAKWLYLHILSLGWHPLMRINGRGKYQLPQSQRWRRLARLLRRGGPPCAKAVSCFRKESARLECTVVGVWEAQARTPWLLLTDLPPAQAQARWYGMRAWIEGGFKDFKRGGWRWEQTKMTHPARAERLWLVMAVATLWAVSVGGLADAERLAACAPGRARRTLSCFAQGLNLIHAASACQQPLPLGGFVPDDPWPSAQP